MDRFEPGDSVALLPDSYHNRSVRDRRLGWVQAKPLPVTFVRYMAGDEYSIVTVPRYRDGVRVASIGMMSMDIRVRTEDIIST